MIRPALLAALGLLAPALASAQATPVPTAPLIGDGNTPSTLQIITPPGARVRATATRGRVDALQTTQGGTLITFTPPLVTERTTVPLRIRVRGGGVTDDFELPLTVVPSWSGSFNIEIDTRAVGSGQSATLKVRASSTGPTDGPRTLRASVSDGAIGNLVPSSDGSFAARFTAPARMSDPGWAVFAIVDDAAPSTFVGADALPITARRSLSFDAPADHTAVLRVGGAEYGPTKVSPAGKVSFEVDLHPEQRSGQLTISGGSSPESRTVELPFEVAGGVAIAPLPDKAGGGTTLTVPIACRTAKGRACTPSDLSLDVSAGSLGYAEQRGDLIFVPWTLPDTGAPTLTARLGDRSATGRVTTLPSPLSLSLTAAPDVVPPGQNDVALTARAKDPAGKGAPGRMPTFEVRNARLIKRPVDNKDGTYTGTWRLDSQAQWLEATAWAQLGTTGLAAQRLVAWPAVDSIAADGASVISLFIVAEDAAGMPVPNVALDLAVPAGDAVVPPSVKTDSRGVARVDVKVGRQPGLVVVVAKGAGLETATRLWQTTPEAPPPSLPALGSAADVEAIGRWRERVAALYVGRGAAVAAAPVAPVATPGSTPTAAATPGAAPGVPTATAGGKPGKVKTAGAGGEYAQARVRALLSNAPFRYGSTVHADGPTRIAPDASFATSPVFGYTAAHAEAEIWPDADRRLGIDFRGRAGVYRVALGSSKAGVFPLEIEGGARYRAYDDGTVSAYAGGGFGRSQGLVIAYTDDTRSAAEIRNFMVLGMRTGGGIRYEPGPLLVELDVQAFWTPLPSIFRGELRVDIPLTDPIALTLGAGGDARFLRYRDGDTDTRVNTRTLGLDIRAGVSAAFF